MHDFLLSGFWTCDRESMIFGCLSTVAVRSCRPRRLFASLFVDLLVSRTFTERYIFRHVVAIEVWLMLKTKRKTMTA